MQFPQWTNLEWLRHHFLLGLLFLWCTRRASQQGEYFLHSSSHISFPSFFPFFLSIFLATSFLTFFTSYSLFSSFPLGPYSSFSLSSFSLSSCPSSSSSPAQSISFLASFLLPSSPTLLPCFFTSCPGGEVPVCVLCLGGRGDGDAGWRSLPHEEAPLCARPGEPWQVWAFRVRNVQCSGLEVSFSWETSASLVSRRAHTVLHRVPPHSLDPPTASL